MGTPEQDLQALAQKVEELRGEMELEQAVSNALSNRILDIRKRCDALARDIAAAHEAVAAQRVAATAPEPETRPSEPLVERIRAVRVHAEEERVPREAPAEKSVEEERLLVAAAVTREPEVRPALEPVARNVAPAATDIETAIGSYWFSRLGAISLLVGFVFLAGYIQPHLTPAIRVALSYLAAVVLCGLGVWAERPSSTLASRTSFRIGSSGPSPGI